MDPLTVRSLSSATANAAGTLRPLPGNDSGKASSLFVQDLTQGLFQRSLQATSLSSLVEGTLGGLGLGQETTASLLAALNAPQAAANATAAATTNPIAVQSVSSTAPSSSPVPTAPAELSAAQDTFAASSGTDFALQTALRFGAGVAGATTPVIPASPPGPGLVRDATSVIRTGSVQAQAGGPGPEAFQRSQTAIGQVLHRYQAATAAPQSAGLDLLA